VRLARSFAAAARPPLARNISAALLSPVSLTASLQSGISGSLACGRQEKSTASAFAAPPVDRAAATRTMWLSRFALLRGHWPLDHNDGDCRKQ